MSAAASPSAPPLLSISNDALSVVFAFLDCPSLNAALSVSKRWSAVILSMRSVGFRVSKYSYQYSSLLPLSCSPLARRHVGVLSFFPPATFGAKDIAPLISLTNLRELSFAVSPLAAPSSVVWSFPLSLRSLAIEGPYGDDAQLIRSSLISGIAQLLLLESLTINQARLNFWMAFHPVYNLAPLAVLPRLTSITVSFPVTPSLADGIRALLSLQHLSLSRGTGEQLAGFCERLTQAPHALRLQQLELRTGWTDRIVEAMSRLPTITTIDGYFSSVGTPRILASFPQLTSLTMELDASSINAQLTLDCLVHLPRLTRLSMVEPSLNCANLAAVLRAMTQLTELVFDHPVHVESLRCFAEAAPTLSRSLTKLTMYQLDHPALVTAEFEHLRGLRSLTHLCLQYSRDGLVDDATKQALTPPSAWLPKLETFQC